MPDSDSSDGLYVVRLDGAVHRPDGTCAGVAGGVSATGTVHAGVAELRSHALALPPILADCRWHYAPALAGVQSPPVQRRPLQ